MGRTTAQPSEDAAIDGGADGRDDVILAALASGSSYAEAANLAGVSTRTVARRMADAEFASEVAERRRQHFGVIADSRRAGRRGRDPQRDVMNAERPADQLKAAVILLGEARRLHQLMDVDTRLRKILRLLETSDDAEDGEDAEDTGSLQPPTHSCGRSNARRRPRRRRSGPGSCPLAPCTSWTLR